MSMSDRQNIDLATRARWQRWEMDSLEALKKSKARLLDQKTKSQQQAQLEKARNKIVEQARQEGLNKGYNEGFIKGQKDGHKKGLDQGEKQGFEQGQQKGYDDGFKSGVQAGRIEGDQQATQSAQELKNIVQSCAQAIAGLEQETGQAIIDLSIKIAEQVLMNQIETQSDHILNLVKELMSTSADTGSTIKIRLNPRDLDLVNSYLQEEDSVTKYRLIADEQITAGGCIAETEQGSVDATIETRWHRIIAALGKTN